MNLQQKADAVNEATKAAPPVTVAGATLLGADINSAILWLTLFYLVLQIGYLLWKWRRHYVTGRASD
jgi:hypothetical protein